MSIKNTLKMNIFKKIGIDNSVYGEFGRDYPEIILKYFLTPIQLLKYLRSPLVNRQSPNKLDSLIVNDFYYIERLKELRKFGYTLLPGYFDRQTIDSWRKNFGIDCQKGAKDWNYGKGKLTNDNEHSLLFKDSKKWNFLKILSAYYGQQAYFRDGIAWSIVDPPSEKAPKYQKTSDSLATKWHFDTPLQTTVHIFLTDRYDNYPTTEFAIESHKVFRSLISERIDWYYSDKYTKNKYKTKRIYGEKGTVLLFDSNILHRAFLGTGGRRENIHINFTPGNNFKSTRNYLAKYLNKNEIIQSDYWLSMMGGHK